MHANSQFIGREFVPPISGGYTASLTVGADEGKARTFDVDFDWVGNVATAEEALSTFRVSVKPARET